MPNDRVKLIHFTPNFLKSFKKLHPNIQKLAIKKESWFRGNPFDRRLRAHKLKGRLEGVWSYSINDDYRVLFRFIDGEEVIYYDIGTHGIYS